MIYQLNFLYLYVGWGGGKRKAKLDTTFLLENGMCIMHVGIFIYDVQSSIYWTCSSLHIFLKCKIRYLFMSASQMSSLVLGIL